MAEYKRVHFLHPHCWLNGQLYIGLSPNCSHSPHCTSTTLRMPWKIKSVDQITGTTHDSVLSFQDSGPRFINMLHLQYTIFPGTCRHSLTGGTCMHRIYIYGQWQPPYTADVRQNSSKTRWKPYASGKPVRITGAKSRFLVKIGGGVTMKGMSWLSILECFSIWSFTQNITFKNASWNSFFVETTAHIFEDISISLQATIKNRQCKITHIYLENTFSNAKGKAGET